MTRDHWSRHAGSPGPQDEQTRDAHAVGEHSLTHHGHCLGLALLALLLPDPQPAGCHKASAALPHAAFAVVLPRVVTRLEERQKQK